MNFIRRLFRFVNRRRWARVRAGDGAGYGVEVLFAGWVDIPRDLRESKASRIR